MVREMRDVATLARGTLFRIAIMMRGWPIISSLKPEIDCHGPTAAQRSASMKFAPDGLEDPWTLTVRRRSRLARMEMIKIHNGLSEVPFARSFACSSSS